MTTKSFQVGLCALLLLCLSVANAQLFLQLSGAEDLPSIPLPLDNEHRPVQLCTAQHPVTIRCDATIQGSTRATFFVNGARYHMEFFKAYYIARNRDKVSRPWIHPDGLTTVECRLNNKERFTTYILFQCPTSANNSPESSFEPSVDENLNGILISNDNEPKSTSASASIRPSSSPTASITATTATSSTASDTTTSKPSLVGPTELPQTPPPKVSAWAVPSASPTARVLISVSPAPSGSTRPKRSLSTSGVPTISVQPTSEFSHSPSPVTVLKKDPSPTHQTPSASIGASASITETNSQGLSTPDTTFASPSTSPDSKTSGSTSETGSPSKSALYSTSPTTSAFSSPSMSPSTSISPSPNTSPSFSTSPSSSTSPSPSISTSPTSSTSPSNSKSPTPSALPIISESSSPSPQPRRQNDALMQAGNQPSPTPVSASNFPSSERRACIVIDATKTDSGALGNGWEVDSEGGVVFNKQEKDRTITEPGKAVLDYRFAVPVKGHYSLVLESRSRQWTEYNDVYVRLQPAGFRFMKNGVFNPAVKGTGWIKIYQNDYGRSFSTKSVDFNAHSLSTAEVLSPGRVYSMQLSGRSNRFTVHRIVMFRCEGTECQESADYWARSIDRCTS